MVKKLIVLEDIYAKLEELIAIEKHNSNEIVHLQNTTSATQIMLEQLANHLGLSTDDYHEDDD